MTKLLDLDPKRRDAILNAALKEFTTKGYDHASTNVIAKEAGISKALMFHYTGSKQELFLDVYGYFSDLMEKEYDQCMDYDEKDIFARLRQSYLLQLRLLEKYPWITELHKLSRATGSCEINQELEKRVPRPDCYLSLFDGIDETKFREGLNVEMCKQFILWANIGLTSRLLSEIRDTDADAADYGRIIKELDAYFEEFRKMFYVSDDADGV